MAWIRSGCGWLRVGDADDEHDAVGCAVDDDDGEHPRLFILAYINDIKR